MRVSFAAAWYTRSPRCPMAATGSMPCQNRWLGSISAPTWVALISVASRAGVEDDVVRVHLDAHLHVGVARPCLDVPPERDGDLAPLVVQRVEELAVPRVDRPRGGPPPGVG